MSLPGIYIYLKPEEFTATGCQQLNMLAALLKEINEVLDIKHIGAVAINNYKLQ